MYFRVLCILCFCVLWIWNDMKRRKNKTNTENKKIKEENVISVPNLVPPDLSGKLPFLGHALRIIGDRKHGFNVIKNVSEEMWRTGNDVLTFCAGPRKKYYILSDPDDCSLVLNVCLDKDYYYSFAKPLIGNGLTIAEVPVWKQHRKFLNPAFKQQKLYEFLVTFNNQSRKLVENLSKELQEGPFDHEKYLRVFNLETTCITAFGSDIKEFDGLQSEYLDNVEEMLKIFIKRFQSIWIHNDIMYSLTGLKKREDKLMKRIRAFTKLILSKKQTEIVHSSNLNESGQFKPFMTQLLDESRTSGLYTEEDILSEINTFIVGAYDTSTSTVTFALILLGLHPEVQQKAYEEIQKVFQGSDRDVDKDDLPKLQYMEAVIKETLRLYPIAPIVSRHIVQDIKLKNYNLKAGNSAVINIWALHRHPKWGFDAELFKPDRWLNPSTLPDNGNYFAGFSLGRRNCIGKNYAMISMKTTLVHLLRSYKFKSDVSIDLQLETDTLLRLCSGKQISIENRLG